MISKRIHIGIDLGTTNSEIAIWKNGEIEVIKNIYGDQYTPSVFGYDKMQNPIVGKKAKERLQSDKQSNSTEPTYIAEIKRLMGTNNKINLLHSKKALLPEEISAEILKSLKSDILRKYPNFDVSSAIVTVPAYFNTQQAEATKRAGKLAGFENVVLVQEPIAASVSYGFNNKKDANIIVYDLGGGTFDVALVQVQEGIISVLNHNGDNFLGFKDVDTAIVDKIIIPQIQNKLLSKSFSKKNDKILPVINMLKYRAEMAKIELSELEKTIIEIDGITNPDSDEILSLDIEFERSQLNEILDGILHKTIDLTKKTIKETTITNEDITELILVGAPTKNKYLREKLFSELGFNINTSTDPMSAVAVGACIFGQTQIISDVTTHKKNNDKLQLEINYSSLTSDEEEDHATFFL